MDEAAVRAALSHYLEHSSAGDEEAAHQIYDPHAVLEFPQSGERFDGVPNFLEWRRVYPGAVEYEVDRVRGDGDVWVAELRVRYDGGPWNFGVDILEFAAGKVTRESIYVTEGWAAPEWRANWRSAPPREPVDGNAG